MVAINICPAVVNLLITYIELFNKQIVDETDDAVNN